MQTTNLSEDLVNKDYCIVISLYSEYLQYLCSEWEQYNGWAKSASMCHSLIHVRPAMWN